MDKGPITKDGLNEFYLKSLAGLPKLQDAMGSLIGEVQDKGVTALQSLEREIMMAMMLLKLAFEDYSKVPETSLRELRSARRELNEHMELLRRMKETNAEFYYGSKYAVRLDQVHDFLKVVIQIVISEIKDPTALKRIIGKIDLVSRTNFKSEVMAVEKTVEVGNVKTGSSDGVGVDRPVAVGNDSGTAPAGGAGSDAVLPVHPEGTNPPNKGDGTPAK